MKCNHCGAELEEGVTLCPNCGGNNAPEEEVTQAVEETTAETAETKEAAPEQEAVTEESEEKKDSTPIVEGKLTPGKIALLVVLAVAAVAVVIALIVGGMGGSKSEAETTAIDATESQETTEESETTETTEETEATEATIPADGNPDDETCKGTYTVTDEEAVAAKDTVVATMGDTQLTNGQLQVYYWTQFYGFLNNYGSYASYFGLDYTQPLDTQLSADGTTTWQQSFLSNAIGAWQTYAALDMAAKEAGFEMPEAYATELESIPDSLESTAAASGFASAQEMIEAEMGAAASLDDYMAYVRQYYNGILYYDELIAAIEVTDEEAETYFDENVEVYTEGGIEKNDDKYVDVRHILIMPEGGTTDEETGETTYSDEEWETARVTAQGILDQWLAGEKTEDSFAQLAVEHSQDGNASEGGLYEDVYEGQMVEAFENWCFDDSRQYGDSGLVQTEYGYHVMFYVGDEPVWLVTARSDLQTEKENAIMDEAIAAYPMEIDYSAIVLGFVDFSNLG